MQRKAVLLLASLSLALSSAPPGVRAQDQAKPIGANDPRLIFSFAIQPGGKPFRFKVKLKNSGTIAGVSVYRDGQIQAFQYLHSCIEFPDQVDENWGWGDLSQLLDHADLNFDGYQDLELDQVYIPHLGKKVYCVFLWDANTERFVYSQELSGIATNLEAHPENKTLTTREDWMGGAWEESTYRWDGGKLELIEQTSLLGDWGLTPPAGECNFTFTCSCLINGKMVDVLKRPVCTNKEMETLPDCSSSSTSKPQAPSGRTSNRQ